MLILVAETCNKSPDVSEAGIWGGGEGSFFCVGLEIIASVVF